MGPSGSGKSTLLHILGTLEPPTSGRVTLGDRDPFALGEPELAAFRNREIGFVFQEHFLLPQCSVLENVLAPDAGGPRRRGPRGARPGAPRPGGPGRPPRPPTGGAVGRREAAGGAGPGPGPEAGPRPLRRAHRQPRRGLGRDRGRPAAGAALLRAGHPRSSSPTARPSPSASRIDAASWPDASRPRDAAAHAARAQPGALLASQRRGRARRGGGRRRARGLAGGGRLGAGQPRRRGAGAPRAHHPRRRVHGVLPRRAGRRPRGRGRASPAASRPPRRSSPCGAWPPTPRADAAPATCRSTGSTSASGRSTGSRPRRSAAGRPS